MIQISAVIITYNEERNIERCLQSLKDIADDIVVLDSFSTDRTREICQLSGVRFYQQVFSNYIEQKNKANEFSTYPYILSLDADEVISEELKQSILQVKKNWKYDGYFMNRMTNYCGKWIRHGNWYPDQKLRLWDKRKGSWEGMFIHEKVEISEDAKVGFLKGDLLHYSYYSIEQHIDQLQKFTTIMAEEIFRKKKYPRIELLFIKPLWKFIHTYFIKLGFLDGYYGFVISIISAYSTFLKYVKARELFMISSEK